MRIHWAFGRAFLLSLVGFLCSIGAFSSEASLAGQEPKSQITHAFLATGGATYILASDGKVAWQYPQGSRDGWVLPNANVLLALSQSKKHPGGSVVEVTKEGKVIFEFAGTQAEVNTVQAVGKDRYFLTEAGAKPRLLEVNRQGQIVVEVALQAQTKNHHLQTRMARKLANGNYLVPQLLDRVVREYSPQGKVVWEVKTPHMPFTAIRLDNGNTLIGCTLGNLVIEVDKAGKTVWQVTNDDLPGRPINDACGVQRLPNGNTVITSHHATGNDVKLTEVTRDKKIVWTHRDAKKPGIHHFQILETNGKALEGRPWR
jgi:outer membrane protein assembly factor BamB